jgi:hypothetical protein
LAVEAALGAPARARALVRAVPAWGWLAGLVVLSAGIRYALARGAVAPWIMVDELIYSELAKSFAEGGRFLVRSQETAAYGVVYPFLLSPAWALFAAVPDAYAAAKAINALLMSLAAVPTFLLARRVVRPAFALLAAALAVAIPPMLYTGTLMTENAFYPVFLFSAWAMARWLEEPSAARTALLALLVLVAYLTRAQAVAFLPALVTGSFLLAGRQALRRYRLMYGIGLAAGALLVGVQLARGSSPAGILGAYEVAARSSYTAAGVSAWLLYHWSGLALALGVVPLAAFLVLAAQARSLTPPQRAFLATSAALAFWLVLEVAAFASEHALRVEERDMFYVGPLFLIALLLWIELGAPRPLLAALVAAAAAASLPGLLPYQRLIGLPAVSDTPSLLPLWSLADAGLGLERVRLLVALVSAAAGLLFLLVPRRLALLFPLLLALYFAAAQRPIEAKWRQASQLNLFAGITAPRPDWIDRALGREAEVAVIWSGNTDRYSIWQNEFFNRSLRRFYYTGLPLAGGLPETPLRVDRDSGLMRGPGGRVVRAAYALTDGSVALQGRVLAQDTRKGMLLYAVHGPLRQLSRVEGLYPQDTWSGATVTYTRLACRGGRLAVELQSDPALYSRPNAVVAYVAGRPLARASVAPRARRVLRVPLRPQGGVCKVRFRVERTLVPSIVSGGANPDPRRLGLHFNRFTYLP